jgi:hypothetical protein
MLMILFVLESTAAADLSSSRWANFKAPIISFHHGNFFDELPRAALKVSIRWLYLRLGYSYFWSLISKSCVYVAGECHGEFGLDVSPVSTIKPFP